MKDCTFPRCGCSEREQCRPEDALKAALARAEAAEKERDEWRQACLGHGEKADRAERQRDEAWTAGAEAMREVCEKYAKERGIYFLPHELRALPIPAQEGK